MKPYCVIVSKYYLEEQNEVWGTGKWIVDVWHVLECFVNNIHSDSLHIIYGVVEEIIVPGLVWDMDALSAIQLEVNKIIRKVANDDRILAHWIIHMIPNENGCL
jgi:hypothetical protein